MEGEHGRHGVVSRARHRRGRLWAGGGRELHCWAVLVHLQLQTTRTKPTHRGLRDLQARRGDWLGESQTCNWCCGDGLGRLHCFDIVGRLHLGRQTLQGRMLVAEVEVLLLGGQGHGEGGGHKGWDERGAWGGGWPEGTAWRLLLSH